MSPCSWAWLRSHFPRGKGVLTTGNLPIPYTTTCLPHLPCHLFHDQGCVHILEAGVHPTTDTNTPYHNLPSTCMWLGLFTILHWRRLFISFITKWHPLREYVGSEILWGGDLVDELVETMLAIGAWLSKINFSSMKIQRCPIHGHTLSVALHTHLLKLQHSSFSASISHWPSWGSGLDRITEWIPTTFIYWQIWVIVNLCATADYLSQKREKYNVPVGYVEPAFGVPGNKAKLPTKPSHP